MLRASVTRVEEISIATQISAQDEADTRTETLFWKLKRLEVWLTFGYATAWLFSHRRPVAIVLACAWSWRSATFRRKQRLQFTLVSNYFQLHNHTQRSLPTTGHHPNLASVAERLLETAAAPP